MRGAILAALALGVSLAAQTAEPTTAPRAKKPYFWFAMWPNVIAQYDPDTDEVVRKIETKHGLLWDTTLTHDRKRYLVVTDKKTKIEVVDIEQGKVVEVHDFAQDSWIIRVSSVRELPGGAQWYVNVDRVERKKDHFVVALPQILLYDVAKKKVEDRLDELPKAIRNGARISPDGTKWHVFDGDIKIVDPKTLKEEGKVDLTTPQFTGMGAIQVYGEDFFDGENPKAYRMLFRMQDPVAKRRRVFGLVDIDLEGKKVATLQEWGPPPDFWNFRMSHDKKVAAAIGRGGDDDTSKIALFDMANGKKLRETYAKFRPRRQLSAISPDGTKLYVGGAGNDFEVYDQDLNVTKTVWLDGDLLGGVDVIDG